MPTPWWHLLATITAWAFAIAGAALLLHTLFHDRSRGRKRCPKCWYDMAGAPTLTCPECGRVARSAKHLLRTRRRRGRALLILVLLGLPAYLLNNADRIKLQGWLGALPTIALVALVHAIDEPADFLTPSPSPPPSIGVAGVTTRRPLLPGRPSRFAQGDSAVDLHHDDFESGLSLSNSPVPSAPPAPPPPRATRLATELLRRCRTSELSLLDRHALCLTPSLHYLARGDDPADTSSLSTWLSVAAEYNLVPSMYAHRLWNAALPAAIRMRSTWVRGEPIRAEHTWHDPLVGLSTRGVVYSRVCVEVIPEWTGLVADTLVDYGSAPADRPLARMPPCPAGHPCRIRLVLKSRSDGQILASTVIDGPQRWVDTCAELLPQISDTQINTAMFGACSVRASTGRSELSLALRVRPLNVPSDLAFAFRATLLVDSRAVGTAYLQLLPRSDTVELTTSIDQVSAANPIGQWQLHIVSDPCVVLDIPAATRCWTGDLMIDVASPLSTTD